VKIGEKERAGQGWKAKIVKRSHLKQLLIERYEKKKDQTRRPEDTLRKRVVITGGKKII